MSVAMSVDFPVLACTQATLRPIMKGFTATRSLDVVSAGVAKNCHPRIHLCLERSVTGERGCAWTFAPTEFK